MNALTTQTDDELLDVLSNNLYPGAAFSSVQMVLGYCRAANLDPMQKPVHIMQVYAKTGTKDKNGKDEYANRDVVMPGIGLYRIQASRSAYAGIDAPVFGPDVAMPYRKKLVEWENNRKTETWVDREIVFPEWCEITVYRIVAGIRCAYTAREYWMENYATAGKDSDSPNAMWTKRPRGQLAKCAEAQALRKAFPEIGSQPTAEEMEGKSFMPDDASMSQEPPPVAEVAMPQSRSEATAVEDAVIVEREPAVEQERPADLPKEGSTKSADDGTLATVGERAFIAKKAGDEVRLAALCKQFGATSLDSLTRAQFVQIRDHLRKS